MQLGEMFKDWTVFKKVKKQDLENYRLVNLTLISGKVMEQLILEIISRHMKMTRKWVGEVSMDSSSVGHAWPVW